jgi:hypothetical protein
MIERVKNTSAPGSDALASVATVLASDFDPNVSTTASSTTTVQAAWRSKLTSDWPTAVDVAMSPTAARTARVNVMTLFITASFSIVG